MGTGIVVFLDLGGTDTTDSQVYFLEVHVFCAHSYACVTFLFRFVLFVIVPSLHVPEDQMEAHTAKLRNR